jgi:hypothetical protein
VSEEPFVLDLDSNPHPALLNDALMIRANAEAAIARLAPLKDYEIDWRVAWRFYLRAMSKATGLPAADFTPWLDRAEVACEIAEAE